MTTPTPLTLRDRTNKQSRTGSLSSLGLHICRPTTHLYDLPISTMLFASYRAYQYTCTLPSIPTISLRTWHRQACTDIQIQLTKTDHKRSWLHNPDPLLVVFKGKRAETALCISISGFVVDGDLGSEKVRDTFAEKLLKLLINFVVCNGQLCSCKMLPACSNQHQQVILKGRRA